MQLATPLPLSPEPSTDNESAREVKLKQYQLENLSRQARRVPGPVILAAAVVAFIAWDFVPSWFAIGWGMVVAAAVFVRAGYSRRPLSMTSESIQKRLHHMVLLSLLNGSVAGIGSAYLFTQLPADRQTLLTMIVVGWTAGAVSANAAYARAFFAYTLVLLTPLAIVWALQGTQGIGIAALLMLFLAIESGFVSDNQRVFRQSFSIRYENEQLIEQLERQRQEILHEKDRAETANLAKSRFLAAASHDIRQPLHTIGLYSAALSLRKTDERSQELARQISLAVGSLASLLDSLLDISKLDAAAVVPEVATFELGALTARLMDEVGPVANEKGLALSDRVAPDLFVHTDAMLLERIVRNLLDNAVKYTPRGSVALRAFSRGGMVIVEVADTGIGIPPKEQCRIYEEFYQLGNSARDRSQGLGLGLAIVHRLAKLLDITLTLKSQEGAGSTFALSLPLAPRPRIPRSTQVPAEFADAASMQGLRVLVIDDEISIRTGMQALLESWGLHVTLAWDTTSSLALAQQGMDLVIADYRLRDSETGLDVIRSLRRQHGTLAAMVISGDTAPERIHELKEENIRLLHKPVAQTALRQAIVEVVGGA